MGHEHIGRKVVSLIKEKNRVKAKKVHYEEFIANARKGFDAGFDKLLSALKSDPILSKNNKLDEKRFIKDQMQGTRNIVIGAKDHSSQKKYKEVVRKSGEKEKRLSAEKARLEKEIARTASPLFMDWADVCLDEDALEPDHFEDCSSEEDEDYIYETTTSNSFEVKEEQNIKDIIAKTTPIAVANGVSENTHFLMISSVINALGVNLEQLSLSRTKVKTVRKNIIQEKGDDLRERALNKLKNAPLQLFIDGKKLKHVNKDQQQITTERLTISATNLNEKNPEDILLQIVGVENGTGIAMAQAVFKV